MLITNSRNHVAILGSFSVRNRDWLLHFTDNWGAKYEPDRIGDRSHARDLILTSVPSLYSSVSVLPPIGSSNHCSIFLFVSLICHNPPPYSRHILALKFYQFGWFLQNFSFLLVEWQLLYFPCFHVRFQLSHQCSSRHGFFFIPNFPKPGKPESPEWFNQAHGRTVRV